MRHLTLEALARLVDEAPDAREEAHLAVCPSCREEREALRTQTEDLGTLPNVLPPPDAWPALRRRMRAEGVMRSDGRRWRGPALTRIAAALALFVAGGAVGYVVSAPAAPPAPAAVAADPAPRASGPAVAGAVAGTGAGASLGEEVERTEELFAAALDRFMRANGTEAPDPAARLAALDHIVITTAEALSESPGDPVINSYHLTAMAQRNELIRQLSATADPVF